MRDANLLYVDLTNKKVEKKTLPGDIYEKYPGGSSLALYVILHEMDPTIDPLSPENILVFAISPLTGYPLSGQSRLCVTAKSPLTETIGDSQVGGYIGAKLAGNNWDAIVVKGKSETPVYLYVDKEDVQLRDASEMWGKITGETEELIKADLGEDIKTESMIIGPGGENMVKYGAIIHQRSRAAGRNGMGAVMGSKNLKALVVRSYGGLKPKNPEEFKKIAGRIHKDLEGNPGVVYVGDYGTANAVDGNGGEGYLASYNFEKGTFDGWQDIGGIYLKEHYEVGAETCYGCAIHCKRAVNIPGRVDPKYGGPEFETLGAFGSYCGINDIEVVCEANMLCNMYGMDTVSCGATIAWAMDCFSRGILTTEQTDGMDLSFGNGDVIKPLVEKIAHNEPGIGALLAKGSARAAAEIGNGAEDLVVTCKKQEWPAHMPQHKANVGLVYAMNPFGSDHQSCELDTALLASEDEPSWQRPAMLGEFKHYDGYGIMDEGKAKYTWAVQRYYAMEDTLCICQFAFGLTWQLYGPADFMQFIKGALDEDWDIPKLLEIGERRIIMMRQFNAKAGFTRADDTLPKKVYIPITNAHGDTTSFTEEEFQETLTAYYKYAGCDPETGHPLPETLERLGLEWCK